MSPEIFQGLPAHRITLVNGDTVLVAEQGAQVLSWVCAGRERLYLSPGNAFDGQAAMRGGVPVCFPQFNQRGNLPKHGFVRNMPWVLQPSHDPAVLTLRLSNSQATHKIWPVRFEVQLTVTLTPKNLRITLDAHNTGAEPWSFTGALHSYFAVDDIQHISLEGLGGQAEWDALTDVHSRGADQMHIHSEFDRVYAAAAHMRLHDGAHTLQISQSASWANTVVWNPGPHKALGDMPKGDHAKMLCVEAAQVFEPITVPAGGRWQGWQHLQAQA